MARNSSTSLIGDQGGRSMRLGTGGHTRPGFDTLLAMDAIEGVNLNTWLWSTSLASMTTSQSLGVLALNASAVTTINTYARIFTNKQFPLVSSGILKVNFRLQANAVTNAYIDWGLGIVSGPASPTQGIFYRLIGNVLSVVITLNSVEVANVTVSSNLTTSYLQTALYIEDDVVRAVGESADGLTSWETFVPLPPSYPSLMGVSHLPAFARVGNGGTAPATPPVLKISGFDVVQMEVGLGKDWTFQLAGTGRQSNIRPDTFAQAMQLTAGTAPTATTPTTTTCAFATLGGEFAVNSTAASENFLGVFGFLVPSPYTLYVTGVSFPPPVVTTTFGATLNIQEWALMIANTNAPGTATGYRHPLCFFSAAASAPAGSLLSGQVLASAFSPPIVVLPGQYLIVMVKHLTGVATGAFRGVVDIRGYYE